ncbi:MAG: hypothetical protein ACI9HK_005054 [Pirellulaceae bacterium]|jgi:uncharacterized protein YaeQ
MILGSSLYCSFSGELPEHGAPLRIIAPGDGEGCSVGSAATMYHFQVELSDIDRNVYETLDFRVARHASEDEERLIVRVLARLLAHEEGMEFGRGLSNVEDAALWTHAPTGEVDTWIDVGLPKAERLHRASKLANKLIVFTHKPKAALRKEWSTRRIHRDEAIEVHRLPPEFIGELAQLLHRKMSLFLTIHDGVLNATVGDQSLECVVELVTLSDLVSNPG